MAELQQLQQLQEFDIPTGREALRGNHSALLRVANYCEDNYLQVSGEDSGQDTPRPQRPVAQALWQGHLTGHICSRPG